MRKNAECHLDLSIDVSMDIWQSLQLFKGSISRERMNQCQLNEFTRLSAYVEKLIVENFGRKTSTKLFNRYQYGYYFNRCCTMNSNCTNWSVKLDIHMKKVDIWFNKICPHQIANKINLNIYQTQINRKRYKKAKVEMISNECFDSSGRHLAYFFSDISQFLIFVY